MRFGIELHTLVAVLVSLSQEVRHDDVSHRFSLVSVSHSHAFYNAALQSATGNHLVGRFVNEGGVVVHVVVPQPVCL